jgi:Raf kinase inhibitor-like YbhB/YbcL family protein
MRRAILTSLMVGAVHLASACAEDEELPTFEVTSFAFGEGETIPARHTCDDEDLSPPLVFDGAPPETAGYAVLVYELGEGGDADMLRWSLWDVPAEPGTIGEGIPVDVSPGDGLSQGRNALDVFGYSGPCPGDDTGGSGERSYVFRVYALSAPLGIEPGVSERHVVEAISNCAIASGELAGVY